MRLLSDVDNSPSVSDLDSLPSLRDIINTYDLRAEKKLGQNFILDQNITDKIVRVAGDISNLHIFEIGPGPGGLTRSILRGGAEHLTAIEYDPRAITALQSLCDIGSNRFTLVQEDALKADLMAKSLGQKRAIIANLPYNIATTLLLSWLRQIREDMSSFEHMTLMFQKEVAERIVAKPNTKAYGRLSIMAQWLCDAFIAFDLPPSAFVPPPKVTSSIVHFRPKAITADAPDFIDMERLVAMAFNQRRKMIRVSLRPYIEAIHAADIAETKRAEDLSAADYVTLANIIKNQ